MASAISTLRSYASVLLPKFRCDSDATFGVMPQRQIATCEQAIARTRPRVGNSFIEPESLICINTSLMNQSHRRDSCIASFDARRDAID
jgi:hypothetical protein